MRAISRHPSILTGYLNEGQLTPSAYKTSTSRIMAGFEGGMSKIRRSVPRTKDLEDECRGWVVSTQRSNCCPKVIRITSWRKFFASFWLKLLENALA